MHDKVIPAVKKLKRDGFEPISGLESISATNDYFNCSVRSGRERLDKGNVLFSKTVPRSEVNSIYTFGKDPKLEKHLQTYANQIESRDQGKINF